MFLPVASDYEPRDFSKFLYPSRDTTTNRIYYYDFDIADLLREGENALNIQLGNMHGSFPSDCPHRERLGYTGDGQIAAPAAMLTLDRKEFYTKWIQDILDCQDKTTGHIQHTAPFMGGGGGPGGWGSAIINVPYFFLQALRRHLYS